MALPREIRTTKVMEVNEALTKMSPREVSGLPSLDEHDFKIIGALVQHFCFIDLNLRRALEVFSIAGKLPKSVAKRYQDLPDSVLTTVVADILKNIDAAVEDLPRALTFLEGVAKARPNRNLAGHFAGKRFPNKDVYVFISKSDKDARRAGISLRHGHVHMAVVGRSEFSAMTESVGQAQFWLANKYQEWEQRYAKPS